MRECTPEDFVRFSFVLINLQLQVSSTSIKQSLTLYTSQLSWNDARRHCLDQGSILVEVESSTKQTQLRDWIDWTTFSNIWIGLHEIDPYDPTRTAWSNCTGSVYDGFSPGQPPTTLDDKHCFYMDTTGLFSSQSCDTLLPFVCQRDLGVCDFDENYPGTGCSLTPNKAELDLNTCLKTCRDAPIDADGKECWAVGFWPGYSEEDCWMFHTVDPRACAQSGNYFSLPSITRYFKDCYDVSIDTSVVASSNGDIIPDTECRLQTTTTPATITTNAESTQKTATSVTTTKTTMRTSPSTTNQNTAPDTTENPNCSCQCNTTVMTNEELRLWQENIKKTMTLNKKNTTLHRRSLISVYDNRISAVAMGSTGVIILSFVGMVLFLIDVQTLCHHFRHIYRKFKKL